MRSGFVRGVNDSLDCCLTSRNCQGAQLVVKAGKGIAGKKGDSTSAVQRARLIRRGHNAALRVRVADHGSLPEVCADVVVTVDNNGG